MCHMTNSIEYLSRIIQALAQVMLYITIDGGGVIILCASV